MSTIKSHRSIVSIHLDRETLWLQGFDVTGMPLTGTRETAHEYLNEHVQTAGRNAINALQNTGLKVYQGCIFNVQRLG